MSCGLTPFLLLDDFGCRAKDVFVNVAKIGDVHVRQHSKILSEAPASPANAHQGKVHLIAGGNQVFGKSSRHE